MLNGVPGQHICHDRGLRQGDLLSPMLFLLIMEVLHGLFCLADRCSLFKALGVRCIPHRTPIYADDIVMFLSPVEQDLKLARDIFDIFEGASGLACNLRKC
jgi:hypothetical protein